MNTSTEIEENWIMKLYVINPVTNRRIYIKTPAETRSELKKKIKNDYFFIKGTRYTINDVQADSSISGSTVTNVAIGSAIGLLGGPLGMLAGAAAGGFIGKIMDDNDKRRTKIFNRKNYGRKKG